MDFHSVLGYLAVRIIVLEPQEPQEVSVLPFDLKGVEHLLDICYYRNWVLTKT